MTRRLATVDEATAQRLRARARVTHAVQSGRLARASTLTCADCPRPAREYDHAQGYDAEHALVVEPVCRACHCARSSARGEVPHGDAHWSRRRPDLIPRGARVPVERRPRGERAAGARLTEGLVRSIRARVQQGELQTDIADELGVHLNTIGGVVRGRTWRHVV